MACPRYAAWGCVVSGLPVPLPPPGSVTLATRDAALAALASHDALDVADALGLTGEEGLVARPAWDGSLIEAWAL